MPSSPTRHRRIVLLAAVALVAALLPTLPLAAAATAAPAVPVAVLLPAPVVTPSTVPTGTVATVTGAQCRPKTSTRVMVSLTAADGDLLATASTVPAADGTWTVHLTPPVGSAAGRYTVAATCDSYGAQVAYRARAVTVVASGAAPWTEQAPALPNVPNGGLTDVDCTSTTRCVAVGHVTVAGDAAPLIETWDGTTWTVAPVSATPGARYTYLSGVSCASSVRCVAVGDTADTGHRAIVVTLANGRWTSSLLPTPTGESEASLSDVSCPTSTSCVAIGGTGSLSEGSRYRAVAYRLVGTTWTLTRDPVATSPRFGLNALSCVDVRTCVAVGSDSYSYPTRPIAEVFDGTVWHSMTLAAVSRDDSPSLRDVSCASSSSCTAVGSIDPGGVTAPFVQQFTGSTWRVARVSTDPSVGGGLSSVDCASTTRCTAVGTTSSYQDDQPDRPVVATRTAQGWTSTVVDVPAGSPQSAFASVSCATAAACVAVGGVAGLPLAAAGAGTGWSDAAAAAPAGYLGGEFDAVACSSTSACTAGGWSDARGDDAATPLVNRWNGSSWSLQTLPDVGNARIAGVACPLGTLCFAAGRIDAADRSSQPLLLQWRGGSWRQVVVRLPRGAQGVLTSVSCSSSTACLAVGQSSVYGGDPVAVAFDGTRWAVTPTPPVGGLQNVTLSGVSCVTGGCRVVGAAYDDTGRQGVDLQWDGSTFTTGPGVQASGAVSCVGLTSCVATPPSFYDDEPVAAVLVGSTWASEPIAYPSQYSTALTGIACRESLTCTVVGSAAGGAYVGRRVSGTWTQQPVTVAAYSQLEGVACPSDTRCVAVGHGSGPTIVVSPTG